MGCCVSAPETPYEIEVKHGIIKNIIGSQFFALPEVVAHSRLGIRLRAPIDEAGCLSVALKAAQEFHAYQR